MSTEIPNREIASITDEELKDLFAICFKKSFSSGGTITYYPASGSSDKRKVLWAGLDRFGLEWSGRHWADCDLDIWAYNEKAVTDYLRLKGFHIKSDDPTFDSLLSENQRLREALERLAEGLSFQLPGDNWIAAAFSIAKNALTTQP